MLVDTHAHLHHEGLKNRAREVIKNAQATGVEMIINVGTNETDSIEAVEMAEAHKDVYATVGLHPEDAATADQSSWPATFRRMLASPKVVGVGECGLDYYRLDDKHSQSVKQLQAETFRAQIELALEFEKPMVWHVRPSNSTSDAFNDFFDIIDEYPGVRGIVHCFSSTKANMQKAVDRGFHIALGGIMTFTKDEVQLDAARALPLKNLVLETDCPFLAPVPMRGKVNEPAFIKHIAEFLANLRGEAFVDLADATTANARKLFGV